MDEALVLSIAVHEAENNRPV